VYLKRIVLHGFKSFADRTEFDFGPGLTMIVGPNGCGKSNILDALRWVLGEQSARSLRGHRMQDVIFAGSRSRKPAHAASVELTFDNHTRFLTADEPEVVVGRVLYRSGESDYRLNGQSCRLKDIRHLFLDTGVGVDAYSVIEQGRVDMLLQANPLERREIFEEAAGISRYKVQRAEAQRKLERTQSNLLRLNDVIDELEKRLRSVKLAASKARRWQEYDARLRERRASFALAEYHELECARRGTQTQIAGVHEQLQSLRTALAARDAEAAEHQLALQQLDEQIQAAETRLASLQTEQAALGERMAQGERRLADLAAARDRRRGQATDIAQRMAELEQRIAEEATTAQTLADAAERSAGRVDELRAASTDAATRRDAARAALDRAKTAAFDAVRQAALLHNERNNLTAQRERLTAQAERLAARQAELQTEWAALAQQRDQVFEQTTALDRQAAELASQLRETDTLLDALETERQNVERELVAAKERRSATRSRLDLLEDLERRREGIGLGTQAVLAWREDATRSGSVVGLVADLLRIDDPRVWALEPVLATFENHVVVGDTYAFLSELARREELPGPVRLFALDRLPSELPRVSYDTAPGFVARACEWVQCRPEHRRLAEHLLGRAIVVDVFERALALATNAPDGYVFVTLDGRSVAVSGRLSVGAAQTTPGLISRKAEIRQLANQCDEIETQLERATRRRHELDERLSDTRLRRNELLNHIAGVQKEHAEARTVLTRYEGELARAQREAAILDSELAGVRRGLTEIEQRAAALLAEALAAGEIQQSHETQIETLQHELADLEAAVSRWTRDLTEALVEAGRTAEKHAASAEALNRLRAGRAALEQERMAAEQEADVAAQQIEELQAEIAAAHEQRAACARHAEELHGEVLQRRESRHTLRLRVEEAGAGARAVQEEIRQREAALHECEMGERETAVRQENLAARTHDDLGLDLRERYATYDHAEQDWDAVRAEIEELREKIARLGNVNLDALTELTELEPRYENLAAQRTDMLTSITRLQTLIGELDRESCTRFLAAFGQIREHFQELFRKLFGGGKADILLEDPEQPLECGIEIMAKPPGKEPQSISLLSGGEKTLTAVALVMAVFKSKPSPFAFLDEVDAALDEANTERFNMLVAEFLVHSQFVVITHSKRTMQCADVLYGVTMEEPGVSQRVSVRFEERVRTPSVA